MLRTILTATAYRTVSVVVSDGIALGSPCCRVNSCQEPLENIKDRFCLLHQKHESLCSIKSCSVPVQGDGYRTCSDPAHVELERRYKAKGEAAFQLTERLLKSQMTHLNNSEPIPLASPTTADDEDSVPDMLPVDDDDDDDELEEGEWEDEEDKRAGLPSVLKGTFGRKRSHNEQLLINPCGMIIARATFYNSESLPSVAVISMPFMYDSY